MNEESATVTDEAIGAASPPSPADDVLGSSGGEGAGSDDKPSVLRQKLNDANARAKAAEEALMQQAYESIGLTPDKGIGKAIAMTFDGAPSELAEFALTEFDHEYAPVNPLAPNIHAAQDRLDRIGQTSGSVPVDASRDTAIAKAEAQGKWQEALDQKASQLGDMMKPR